MVRRRLGDATVQVQTGPSQFKVRHQTQLRAREPDLKGKHVSFDYCAHEADEEDDEYVESDEHIVEKILSHRSNPRVPGGIEFRVKWRGFGKAHDSWEPASAFVPRMNTVWKEYLSQKGVNLQAKDLLAALVEAEEYIMQYSDPFIDATIGDPRVDF